LIGELAALAGIGKLFKISILPLFKKERFDELLF
jgi:hypothetical protein